MRRNAVLPLLGTIGAGWSMVGDVRQREEGTPEWGRRQGRWPAALSEEKSKPAPFTKTVKDAASG